MRQRGFTVVEIMVVLAIVGVLVGIALPRYQDYRERIKIQQAITDIRAMNALLRARMNDDSVPPDNLTAIGWASKVDPWGRPYQYQRLQGIKGVAGKARKNKNLVPLNTDFDLYSIGKDGATAGPLTVPASRDDVLLANDGRFVGLASDYE
jgi:general secretion pathway protein G